MRELQGRIRDVSRCDFLAASRLLERGFAPPTIRQAIREASPDLADRKHGHVEDYVRRTVEAATRSHLRARERGEPGRSRDDAELARGSRTREVEREATEACRRALSNSLYGEARARDFSAAMSLARAGYDQRTIAHALREASPNLPERTRGDVEGYVRGTAERATAAHQRREQERQRERDQGWER
jgi:hypothetical protein